MSAKRQRTRNSNQDTKKQKQKQRGFGRPEDDPLQTFFMRKLRNCKLQVINAESQAEIQCFKFQDANPQAITNRKLADEQDNFSKQKMLMVKSWFKEINSEHYELLWNSFKLGVDSWEFKEINSKEDFPQYLFCDQCDLSYVLYTALNNPQLNNKTQFDYPQLLFFQLLCFAARDQISFRIIKAFKEIYDQILSNMAGLKEKVLAHYQKTANAQKQQENSDKNEQNQSLKMEQWVHPQDLPIQLTKGGAVKMPNEDEDDYFSKKGNKTKKIEKEEKPQKKRQPKKKEEVVDPPIDFKDIEVLLHKLITHIAWAYRYIYPEEYKKKQLTVPPVVI